MSKHFAAALIALPLILQLFNNCFGQDADVTVSIRTATHPIAEIRGRQAKSSTDRNFSILREYAGFSGLADRVSDIRLEDAEGKPVAFKQFIPGEYVAETSFVRWSYQVDLTPPKRPSAAAHISWMNADNGLLFLDDLVPLGKASDCRQVTVTIDVPAGWTALGTDGSRPVCVSRTVYFLSKSSRHLEPDKAVDLTISGEWKFTDKQAADFVAEIYAGYSDLFGGAPEGKKQVHILPFPVAVKPENWEADTRGDTVVIVTSDMPFQTQSVQRLHEQLRHEIFHWWIPNGVQLEGNYDWFYEGSALYESLKLGVAANRLRFYDFLDTLGRAMTVDAAMPSGHSLIDASRSRTSGSDTVIYARGMLIAFAIDLKRLARSVGKDDVSDLLRTFYQKYKVPEKDTDGNSAALLAIGDDEIENVVKNGETINWAAILRPIGIEMVNSGGSVTLRVTPKPSGSQKKLLNKLGYNNWRKASVGPR
jgi:hypothetical protein